MSVECQTAVRGCATPDANRSGRCQAAGPGDRARATWCLRRRCDVRHGVCGRGCALRVGLLAGKRFGGFLPQTFGGLGGRGCRGGCDGFGIERGGSRAGVCRRALRGGCLWPHGVHGLLCAGGRLRRFAVVCRLGAGFRLRRLHGCGDRGRCGNFAGMRRRVDRCFVGFKGRNGDNLLGFFRRLHRLAFGVGRGCVGREIGFGRRRFVYDFGAGFVRRRRAFAAGRLRRRCVAFGCEGKLGDDPGFRRRFTVFVDRRFLCLRFPCRRVALALTHIVTPVAVGRSGALPAFSRAVVAARRIAHAVVVGQMARELARGRVTPKPGRSPGGSKACRRRIRFAAWLKRASPYCHLVAEKGSRQRKQAVGHAA